MLTPVGAQSPTGVKRMRTDSKRKFVCMRRPNPARKSRGARLEYDFAGGRILIKIQ